MLFILFQGKRFQSGSDVSKVRFAFHGGSTFAFWDICVVPIIGVGFVKAIKSAVASTGMDHSEEQYHNAEHELGGEDGTDPARMICFSVAIFLLCSGLVDSSRDRLMASAIIATIPFFGVSASFATFFVPVFMLVCARDTQSQGV